MPQKSFLLIGILFLLLAPFAVSEIEYTTPYPDYKISTGTSTTQYLFPLWFIIIAAIYVAIKKRNINVNRAFYLTHLIIAFTSFAVIFYLPIFVIHFLPAYAERALEFLPIIFDITIVLQTLFVVILLLILGFRLEFGKSKQHTT